VPLNRWSLRVCSSQALEKCSLLTDNTHQVADSVERAVDYTGTQVNYYFICKRKLWLFSHGLEMEETSDLVLLGRLLHERGYQRKRKEVQVGRIKIDFVGPGCEIQRLSVREKQRTLTFSNFSTICTISNNTQTYKAAGSYTIRFSRELLTLH
jgi:hypothetical protein